MRQTISIIVSGKVQGVFFRQRTVERALKLQVCGTVRNLVDGNVEVIATGTAEQLEQLMDWCRRGPERAVVTAIDVEELELQEFEGFRTVR